MNRAAFFVVEVATSRKKHHAVETSIFRVRKVTHTLPVQYILVGLICIALVCFEEAIHVNDDHRSMFVEIEPTKESYDSYSLVSGWKSLSCETSCFMT
jgi:hypothetical protein